MSKKLLSEPHEISPNLNNTQKENKSSKRGGSKFLEFFSNPKVKYSILAICVLIVAYLVQYFVNKPNFGTFLSSDMDPLGNVYVLGVDEEQDQYKVTKVSKSGASLFSINLEKSNKDYAYHYSNMEADTEGNFYFVKEQRDLKAVVSDKSLYPIKRESVLMYDTNGNYIKEVVSMDFSKYTNPPTKNYIKKLQLVNQSLTVVGCIDENYDVITANPLLDESPKKTQTFAINPPYNTMDRSLEWVSDICVLSNGRVFYATRNGEFWGMDNQGVFMNYSNAVSNSQFILLEMNVDVNDNIYFNDTVTGNFYKFDTKSIVAKAIYGLDSYLDDKKSISMRDVRKVKVVDENNFYAPSKAFNQPFYIKIGEKPLLISDVRGKFFPWGLLIMAAVCLLAVAIYFIVKYLSNFEIKRIPLAVRILSMFFPVYLISMGVLVYINTSDAVVEYMSILKSEQERGAKTVADCINGGDFSKLNQVSDYMNPDYVKLKKSIYDGYSELTLKIGDKSDYLVTYIEHYDKLYATSLTTKYGVTSGSYDELKYTDPDMVSSEYALVDTLLERDEAESLYNIWNQFSKKTNQTDSLEANFRDVYGNIMGSFVAIKNNNGNVVGFVGNYLDSDIHSSREFWRIFKHSLAIVLIVTIFVFAYLCFVIKLCLRPLKKIEKAINTMGKGKWDTKIQVKTKDELADIASAFNLMSEKIDRYTSNLIRLNKEYIRYVPTEIFRLMNKEKITQVQLYDHSIVNMNMLYVTFNLPCKGTYDFKDEDEIFEALSKTYLEMFKVVENNNGIVQSFDGLDAVILFPESATDAFNASIQFKEVDIHKSIKKQISVTLGSGDVLIGVSGDKDRRGVVVVSDEIMQMFNIDAQIQKIGINHVATKSIIDCLSKDAPYSYRFIGRVGNITGEGYTEIYEIIEASNKYKKDLYLSTKEFFEKAVNCYLMHDFEEARRIFTDVLRVNENDKVSIHYLMKCEEQMGRLGKNSMSGKGFTGYLM